MTHHNEVNKVNLEAKKITEELEIPDRVEQMSELQSFITIKDHKANFETNTKCRLINPSKSQIGIISKQILQKHNKNIKEKLKLNQWQSTQQAIDWFNGISNKSRKAFLQMDIEEFYPSISEELLDKAIHFATTITREEITQHEIDKSNDKIA